MKTNKRPNAPDVFALVVLAGAASGEFMFGVAGAFIGVLAGAYIACQVRFG